MTALLAGIDISTKALHAAVIPLDPDHGDPACVPVQFRTQTLPAVADEGLRYKAIHVALRHILSSDKHGDIVLCYVEKPRSPHHLRGTQSAQRMAAVYGAVMASTPPSITSAALEPLEVDHELGLPRAKRPLYKDRKARNIDTADRWLTAAGASQRIDEHQADALLVALAGRQLNARAWSEGAA